MYQFESMLYQSREGVFSAWFNLHKVVSEPDLLKVFMLIEKYYPRYSFKFDDFLYEKKKWEDFILSDFVYRPNAFNNINLTTNMYVQDLDFSVIIIEPPDEVLEIIYGSDNGLPVFGVQVYPFVYFDKNIIYIESFEGMAKKKEVIDQSIAAKMNRSILIAFMKELEQVIGSDISYFEGSKRFSEEYVFKYGIKDDARLYDIDNM